MSAVNRIPAPGAQALEVRTICGQLTRATATIAPHGITNFDAIDAAGAEFLLSIIEWETADESGKPRFWAYVLGEFNAVTSAWRQAASLCAMERDGEAGTI